MPPPVVGAILSTGVGVGAAALKGAVFTFGTFSGFSAVAASIATYSALGYAMNALTPKPTSSAGAGYQVNQLASAAPSNFIYGAARVGGVVFYQETTSNNQYLHRCIALAGHEVNDITEFYIDDVLVPLTADGTDENGITRYIVNVSDSDDPAYKYNGYVRVKKHLGKHTDGSAQKADADLISESSKWTSDHKAQDIAYLYVRLKFSSDKFPNGVPVIKAKVEGKKVQVPNEGDTGFTEDTQFSSNPACCLRDYLLSIGVAESSEIDDVSFITAAGICDDPVALAFPEGDTETRYTTNGTFLSDASPQDVIQGLLGSMGGMIWYSQGKWGCKAAAATVASLELTEDDLRGSLSIATRVSRRDAFNRVMGVYKGEETNFFESSYPSITSDEFLEVDGGYESEMELNLPFTSTSTMAQRIAKIALYRNREQLKISGTFGMRAMNLGVGDIVQITNSRLGFDAKDFEVTEWSFALTGDMTLQVSMSLQEISSAVFEPYVNETAFESNNTTLLSPFYVPSVSVTLSQEYRVVNETITNVLLVDTSSSNPDFVDAVEIEYRKNSDDFTVLGVGDLGRFSILNIEVPTVSEAGSITYEVRARGINSLGVKGNFSSTSKVIEADTTPPSAPTSFEANLSGGSIFFKWEGVPELDLSYYRLYHSSSTTATFGDGSQSIAISKIARPATSASFPALSGTFFVRAFDKSGNGSTTASHVINPSELPVLGNSQTATEDPSFSGSKGLSNQTEVVSSELRIDADNYNSSDSFAYGSYYFDNILDVGTARTVRVSYDVSATRHHSQAVSGEVDWDYIPNNWDTWTGNWDDWSDEDHDFGDIEYVVSVRGTSVDAGGGTPDFSGVVYVPATGEITGRWFQFAIVLKRYTQYVTPSVSELSGTVEY
jgi:hypothetical protein